MIRSLDRLAKKKQSSTGSGGLKDADAGGTKRRRKKRAKPKKEIVTDESPVEQYVHPNEKRANNPPVGLVDPNNDPDQPSKSYSYDPRLDPQLQWSGKSENSEFDIDIVSLHVHERIDPLTIIEKAMKWKKNTQQTLFHYFETPENNPPLRDAIDFYKHDQNWKNRLIAGDSLLVMNSLLEKEGMEGKVQMIYIDPPYGIKYGSNFQPYVNQRDVKDGNDEDLTQEPEMIKAFRDTWELEIHSYMSYLRDRLLLSKKLLTESGSCFVQISDENIHHVREIMDEVFGAENFVNIIIFSKTGTGLQTTKRLSTRLDYILWYAKDRNNLKYNQLFEEKDPRQAGYDSLELQDGTSRKLTSDEKNNLSLIPKNTKLYTSAVMTKQAGTKFEIEFNGKKYTSGNRWWGTAKEGIQRLIEKNRVIESGSTLRYKRYFDDWSLKEIDNLWIGFGGAFNARYVVETNPNIIQRCMIMTTDSGDLVFDPTCGGGTTAFVAEHWGRRWITCDTSRVAIALSKQRLITSFFDYYQIVHTDEGVKSGFKYKAVPHITLRSIANDEPSDEEILYDKPFVDKSKVRITGPFTIEAVPSPIVKSIDVLSEESNQDTIQTKASTQQEWRDELLRAGIRGKEGQRIEFSRVESHPTTKWLHADAETKEAQPKRVMVSFGPEHSQLEQRQVSRAVEESQLLVPKPKIIIFAAMAFDSEAAKDIDETNYPGVTLLKAMMNSDMQTKDLKKKQTTSESFWLMGSPDVECKKQKDGKYIVTVNGFDYYNTKTDEIESGGASKIAMWVLDTDYDGRSVYPQQVFFPMEGKSGGWEKLAKTLQAYIDEDLITKYQGTESIPFEAGPNKRVAVKIIDDRGIESLKLIDIE